VCRHLVLIRHAETESRYSGRYLGATDVPRSARGHRQAIGLTHAWDRLGPERCFCSPLLRTRQTLDPIIRKFNVPVEFNDPLREVDFGRWEGLTFAEIAAQYPAEVNRWAGGDLHFSFPGGESMARFVTRIEQVADRMVQEPSNTIAVMTHGGVIRFMLCYLLGLPFEKYLLFDIKPASLTLLDIFDGKGVLAGLNDRCHLEGI
jgi:alpha-ribazole phosphatase